MAESFFHRLSSILWGVLVLALVVLALYVSVGRLLVSSVDQYREALLQELNLRAPFDIEAEVVSGEWRSFSPVFVFSGLRLGLPESTEAPLELTEGQLGVDVWSSLRSGSLQFTHLVLEGLSLHGEFSSQGKLRLRGIPLDGGEGGNEGLRQFLLTAKHIVLRDNKFRLSLPSGEARDFDLDLQLTRRGSDRRVQGTLLSTRGTNITVLGRGLGDPFQPDRFSGELYVDVESADLGAARDVLGDSAPPIWPQGELEVAFWLSWERGVASVQTEVEARNLLIAPDAGDWRLPLEKIAFQAHIGRVSDHWKLFATDVELENSVAALQLPQLQVDAWGNAMRLRALDIPVAEFAAFALGLETTPAQWRALISDLGPEGRLGRLQLNIADFEQPMEEWEFEANFDALSLQPYRGAPGASSAAGYVQLGSGGGTVVLDAPQMALSFPQIYAQSLGFDQFFGTLDMSWTDQALNLSSGLITATDEEGTVRALFGLDVPFRETEAGVEMELLVGLEDTHPRHREKYIPEVLDAGLRDWLRASIGDGLVTEGSFLWRGSLKSGASRLRTVQLAFNVEDTVLEYHPAWPPVTVADASIFIDDGRVNAWSPRAQTLNSDVSDLVVEIMPVSPGKSELSVLAQVNGPAEDGLTVVNDSPLGDIVGATFRSWKVNGGLNIGLDLRIPLGSEGAAPVVAVQTSWSDVDARIAPGDLPLENLNGQLNYRTATGFSSRELTGELWGESVVLDVRQLSPGLGEEGEAGPSVLEVAASTRVEMSRLQQWLDVAPLSLAEGKTPVNLSVLVEPGEVPLLKASSTLEGVTLDLPEPWKKAASTETALELVLGMAADEQALSLRLGQDLALELAFSGRDIRAGTLDIGGLAAAMQPGEFRIAGEATAVDAQQYFDFVQTYFLGGDSAAGPPDTTRDLAPDAPASSDTGDLPLTIVVEKLRADNVSLSDRVLSDAVLSGSVAGGSMEATLEGDWLRGKIYWPLGAGRVPTGDADIVQNRVELLLDYLDMSRLVDPAEHDPAGQQAEGAGDDSAWFSDLPTVAIQINDLYQGERPLGNVGFTLYPEPAQLRVEDLHGELAQLRFGEETPASLSWRGGEQPETAFAGRLSFEDLGKTLSDFGYEKIIQTRRGNIDVDIRWPGAPADFSLDHAQGSLLLDVGSGSFLSAPSGAAGALRVVNILNLMHIVQRLSVTHMFDSGIPFDSVQGEVYFHDGTIEVPRIDVRGGSKFQFSGVSDVATRGLNGELVATLPVAKNLPWVAALAASLPVAAGVYVVSKIFDKQVNRLSSAVYRLEGTWDEPQASFDRIFDDSSPALPTRIDLQRLPDDAPLSDGVAQERAAEEEAEFVLEGVLENESAADSGL